MSYTLVQTSPGNINVTEDLESFFLCYRFNVDTGKKFLLQQGFFAVYISQKSGPPLVQSLYDDSELGKGDQERKLELSNTAGHKILVNYPRLVNSRFSQFSNEISQLHLFEFNNNLSAQQKNNSIDTKGWTPDFNSPQENDDGIYFLEQTLSFADVKSRYVYWLASQTNSSKTERFALAVPFVSTSLIGTICGLHNQFFPKVEISVDGKLWSYPDSNQGGGQGALQGFVMVVDGAFKAIPLSVEIDTLCELIGPQGNNNAIISYLSRLVHSYPTKVSRNLSTVSNTQNNSIILSDPKLPIEILYMEGLNEVNPVPLIFK
jgi:hypothetical protein